VKEISSKRALPVVCS